MASTVLDQTQDLSGTETHRLTKLYPPPDFVKQASHSQIHGDPQTLPRHVYADQRNRLYPTHTAPATWVSTLFFLDKAASYTPAEREVIDQRLRDAAKHFGIAGPLEAERQKVASASGDALAALSDDDFALVWQGADGNTERKYPLRNQHEVKVAADYFGTYLDEFVFEDRHRIANRLLDKAAQFDLDLGANSERFEKTAGWGITTLEEAALAVEARARLLRTSQPEVAGELQKMAGILRSDPNYVRSHQTTYKLAALLDQADCTYGLTQYYATGQLSRPEETLFAITEKVARAFQAEHFTTTTGNVYALSDMEKLAADTLREWMGSDFAEAVGVGGLMVDLEKLAEVVPTLDRGAADMFDKMLAAANIQPVVKEKIAADAPLAGPNLMKRAAARLQQQN